MGIGFAFKTRRCKHLKTALLKLTPFLLINRFLTQEESRLNEICFVLRVKDKQSSHASHTIQYCTIAHSRCEIYDDVMVVIWNFALDMYGHELNILLFERY